MAKAVAVEVAIQLQQTLLQTQVLLARQLERRPALKTQKSLRHGPVQSYFQHVWTTESLPQYLVPIMMLHRENSVNVD